MLNQRLCSTGIIVHVYIFKKVWFNEYFQLQFRHTLINAVRKTFIYTATTIENTGYKCLVCIA